MGKLDDRVMAETLTFQAAMPELMKTFGGRWVVFLNGNVQSDHGTADEAYEAALTRFGVDGGYVLGPVAKVTPTPVTAGVVFGLA